MTYLQIFANFYKDLTDVFDRYRDMKFKCDIHIYIFTDSHHVIVIFSQLNVTLTTLGIYSHVVTSGHPRNKGVDSHMNDIMSLDVMWID